MTTTTINNTGSVSSRRADIGTATRAPRRGFFARLWGGLLAFGEGRAKAELARHIRLHGGRPTGDLAQDVEHLAALRGVR